MSKGIKFFGPKSLSSFIYILLYLAFIDIGVGIAITIFQLIGNDRVTIEYLFGMLKLDGGCSVDIIGNVNKQIIINYGIKGFLYALPVYVVLMAAINYLIDIFKNFSRNKIFVTENFSKIKILGILMIVASVYKTLEYYFISKELVNIKLAEISFKPHLSSDWQFLIGILVLIIAEAFKKAVKMQEEQELTI